MPTYHDYVWIQQYLNTSLSLGYCAALIPRSTPAQVLSALGADENTQSEAIGIAELGEVMSDLTEQPETAGAGQVVAVAAVGDDSTLLMQINGGSFAISEELMRPLLSDREVASHYLSVNADSQFIWWSNGTRVAEFELFGSSPVVEDDRMVDLILDVGGIGIDDDAQGYAGEHALEGAFALAEQITGVAVPASLFVEGQFMVAVVPKSGQSPSADVPSEASPRKSPAAWSEVARRYKAAERIPLHGVMFRGRPPAVVPPCDSNSGSSRAPASVSKTSRECCFCRTDRSRRGSAPTGSSNDETADTVSTSISNNFSRYTEPGRTHLSPTYAHPTRQGGK